MAEADSRKSFTMLLKSTAESEQFVGFRAEEGEEHWLKEVSIVGGMAGAEDLGNTVYLTETDHIFERHELELRPFVCSTP